jgi:hypothetical protein
MAPPFEVGQWDERLRRVTSILLSMTSGLGASVAVVLAIAAAHGVSTEPELGRPFDMKPSEVVVIQGLRITFEGISEDSRCPTGAQCIWAGDAAAEFTLHKAPSEPLERTLHTNGRFERQTQCDAFVVRLEDVKPYPKQGAPIAPGDYRATIVVTRR